MDNRELIMQSALELFYARGYDAVGVQEIVDRAGVTKPTLYYYFGSKLGLLQKLLESQYQVLDQGIEEAAKKEGNLPEVLYAVARYFFDFAASHEKFYLFMLALFYSGRKSDGYQTVYPFVERYYRLFVNIFEQASDELGNMNGRQRQFAMGFIGILHYYLMLIPQDEEQLAGMEVPEQQIQELVRQFMYGIYS